MTYNLQLICSLTFVLLACQSSDGVEADPEYQFEVESYIDMESSKL